MPIDRDARQATVPSSRSGTPADPGVPADADVPGKGPETDAVTAGAPAGDGTRPATRPGSVPAAGRPRLGWWDLPLAVMLVLGVVLRLRQWRFGRSLWLDETAIGWNIHVRGFGGLLKPLSLDQAAPFGWLWLERIAVDIGGLGEHTLRLVPLLFGIGLLVVLAWAARDLFSPVTAAAVVALASVGQYLVYYSNETKQYSAEAFWCAALVVLGIALVRRGVTARRAVIFWATALVAATMSMLAIPVAGVVGLIALLADVRSAERRRRARLRELWPFLVAGAVWLAGALAIYLAILRPAQGNPALRGYWQKAYPAKPLSDIPATLSWLRDTLTGLFGNPLDLRHRWVFAALLLVAAVRCWRRYGPAVLLILVSPWVIGLAAATVRVYPMANRLALFAVPGALLLLGCAIDRPTGVQTHRWPPAGWRSGLRLSGWAVTWCLLIAVAASTTITAYRQFVTPYEAVQYRQTVRYIAEHQRPGDVVLGTVLSRRALMWYGPEMDVTTAALLRRAAVGAPCANLATVLHGHTRAWLVEFTDWTEWENWFLRSQVARYGTIVQDRYLRGTRIVEYDLTRPPPGGAAPLPAGSRCVELLPAKM